jgi:FkbM family methyltransferase
LSDLDEKFFAAMPRLKRKRLKSYRLDSKSQLRQDLFILSVLDFKRNGFFVEFGAADGICLSNSWLLENQFGWQGILAEPARKFKSQLELNRTCIIDRRCVWGESGLTLSFCETTDAHLSTLQQYTQADMHAGARLNAMTYEVNTVSLNDLLREYKAPTSPDFLSIDTEGSEFEILKKLDFDRWIFKVICCEHNFGPQREKIHELLIAKNYSRVYQNLSQYDDWYIHSSVKINI